MTGGIGNNIFHGETADAVLPREAGVEDGPGSSVADGPAESAGGDIAFENETIFAADDDTATAGDGTHPSVVGNDVESDTSEGCESVLPGADDDMIDLSGLMGPVTDFHDGDNSATSTDDCATTITFSELDCLIPTDHANSVNAISDSVGISGDAGAGDDTVLALSGTSDDRFGYRRRLRWRCVSALLSGLPSLRARGLSDVFFRCKERLFTQSSVTTGVTTAHFHAAKGLAIAFGKVTPLVTAATAGYLVLGGPASLGS